MHKLRNVTAAYLFPQPLFFNLCSIVLLESLWNSFKLLNCSLSAYDCEYYNQGMCERISRFHTALLLINLYKPSTLITCSLTAALSHPFLSRFTTELGSGPFSLVSAVFNDTVFGVNRTSSTVFPLLRERPGHLPSQGIMFNFMITVGLQRDRTSREHPFLHNCT